MELWLDSCNLSVIQKAKSLGLLYGVTTNPLLLAKETTSPLDTLKAIIDIHLGPITAQVTASTSAEMIHQAKLLSKLSQYLIVKIPASHEGLLAMHILSQEGIATMATAVYDTLQGLCSFRAGAAYIACYIGRMEQNKLPAFHILDELQTAIERYTLKGKILAASLKTREQLHLCLQKGFAAVTMKENIFNDLIRENPYTLKDLQEFQTALDPKWI